MLGATWDRDPTPPAPLPEMVDLTDWNPSWAFGTGQAIRTATDLAIWAEALATGDLLDPAMQKQCLDWHETGASNARYGLAVNNLDGLVWHNGEIGG